jgi:putative DNA primase/helicase
MFLLGEGQNGKSKFVSVLRALAGKAAVSALSAEDLNKDTNRYMLETSLFNISEEMPKKAFLDSSIFKNLVGGGEITAKKLYENAYTMQNRAKFWFLCNELPKTYDLTHGMFRRMLIVPFEAVFSGDNDDKNIEEKLFAELPGILNLCLEAYQRMKLRGGVYNSEVVQRALQSYKEDVDQVRRWFKDNVSIHQEINGQYIPASTLYGAYKFAMEQEGERPLSNQQFIKRIEKILPTYNQRKDRLKEGGKQVRVLRGIEVNDGSNF